MGVLLFLINIQSEVIGPVEVIGLGDAGASRRAAAARGEQHPAVVHADIIDHREAIVCHSLFKGPEKIVGRGHEQRAVLDRVLLIPTEGRVLVLFGDAVKALYKGLRAGRYRPEKEGRREDQQIGGLYIGNDVVEIVLLDTWLAVTAGIAAETSVDRLFPQGYRLYIMPGRFGAPGEGLGQLLGVAVDPAVVKNDKDIFRRMLCPPFGFSFILPFSFCIVCNL